MTQPVFDPSLVAAGPDDVRALAAAGRELHVEIGFGKDVRILREAVRRPDALFLGVEISRKKAASFCRKAARAGLRNVRAYHGDARLVLAELLPPESVQSFTILFPDPWPKRRHWKHRWIQPGTAAQLVRAMRAGAEAVVATDHDGYVEQIRDVLAAAGLSLEYESREVPDEDRTLFAERFDRLGESVTYLRWRKSGAPTAPGAW